MPEFNKPQNVTCKHCTTKCTIYEDRPKSCRDFKCQWLKGELPEDMRPDLAHFILEQLIDVPVILCTVEPGYEYLIENKSVLEEFYNYKNNGIAVVTNKALALIPDKYTPGEVKRFTIIAAKKLGII
jgi:hypothetical protein